MDFFGHIWKSINNLIFPNKENIALPTEKTVAPINQHPIEFDITSKPAINPASNASDPLQIQNIFYDLLNSFADDTADMSYADVDDGGVIVIPNITAMDIPDKNGHTLVKVVEDATGETIELLHESLTELAENVTDKIATSVLNGTKSTMTPNESVEEHANYINVYIIAALILILVLAFSAGGIMWCKKNRLKAEKRNQYPVMTAQNNEYMNPQMLKNNEKLKNIP